MSATHRNIVFVISALLVLGSLVAYVATGAKAFTRFPSEELEAQQHQQDAGGEDLDALFEETGVDEGHGELEDVESEFTFGLLPGGPGAASISVASFAGIAVALSAGVYLLERRSRARNRAQESPSAGAPEQQ